jgi:hypothetical protein
VDPRIINQPPGISERQGRSAGETGVAHLQRLKAHTLGQISGNDTYDDIPKRLDRRRSPRFNCSGSVEFQTKERGVRLWGALTDISLHGCYVEMAVTFPVETVLTITVQSLDIRFSALTKVRAAYPSLGMGLCFVGLKPDQQAQLEHLLKAIVHQADRAALPPVSNSRGTDDVLASSDSPSTDPACTDFGSTGLGSIDTRKLADKLTEHFRTHGALSRDDFYNIAKRLRHS